MKSKPARSLIYMKFRDQKTENTGIRLQHVIEEKKKKTSTHPNSKEMKTLIIFFLIKEYLFYPRNAQLQSVLETFSYNLLSPHGSSSD